MANITFLIGTMERTYRKKDRWLLHRDIGQTWWLSKKKKKKKKM